MGTLLYSGPQLSLQETFLLIEKLKSQTNSFEILFWKLDSYKPGFLMFLIFDCPELGLCYIMDQK